MAECSITFASSRTFPDQSWRLRIAMVSAARKKYGHNTELEAQYNEEIGEVELFQFHNVVEKVEDPDKEISFKEAKKLDPEVQVGDELGEGRFEDSAVGFDIVTVQKAAASLLLDGIAIVLQSVIGMAVLAFYHPFLLGFDIVLLISINLIVFALGSGAVKTAVVPARSLGEE